MTKALMFLGTASESGKSVMAAAFCRILKRRGVRVAPFKSQNMALNSGVTPEGLEMGRAQIVQAECAGLEPRVDMNPVLLKPTSEKGSQVIVHGVVKGDMDAAEYYDRKRDLWPAVTQSYDRLAAENEVMILEGAGSPVEINLKEKDIVNMAMADYADAKVVLVADIDRGGVFASIVGTVALLAEEERRRLIGFIINKFRGDVGLFAPGMNFIEQRTGFPVLGVVPLMRDLYVPGEDSVSLENRGAACAQSGAAVSVAVICLPHISNYTDFDPLECDRRFRLSYIRTARELEGFDAVILPGSKNVFFDYRFLSESGLADRLLKYRDGGGKIVGICGGYQMLGRQIRDPLGVEANVPQIEALGLLPVSSEMEPNKTTEQVQCSFRLPGRERPAAVAGYEIHMGRTLVSEIRGILPLTEDGSIPVGLALASRDGNVWGTYVHGLFDSDALRDEFIGWAADDSAGVLPGRFSYAAFKDENYNRLTDAVEKNVEVGYIFKKAGIEA